MLEIILLIVCGKKLASMARAKGRSAGWAGLGVLLWIGGELIGLAVGAAIDLGLGVYLSALFFAGIGMTAAFIIVSQLQPSSELAELYSANDQYTALPSFDLSAAQDPANPYSPPRVP